MIAPTFRRGADEAQAETPAPNPPKTFRPNLYPGTCSVCSTRVAEMEGTLDKVGQAWVVSHLPGECPDTPVPTDEIGVAPVAAPGEVVIKAVTGQVYTGLQPGIYTLPTDDGHRTFRVRVQSTDDDFAPGSTILEYLSGPDNERDYTGFAFLKGTRMNVWRKHQDNEALVADARQFLADPSKALLSARCIRCNLRLTTEESIKAMMGPDCRNKGW